MRKILLMMMLVVLVLVPATGIVQATPVDDLTNLAAYFPEGTVAFAAINLDDSAFDTVDGLLNQVNDNLGGEMLPPGFSSRDLLDLLLIEQTGLSQEILFSWLGDSAAVGIPALDFILAGDTDQISVMAAAEITDRAGAEDFMRMAAGSGTTETSGEGYTLFADEFGASALISDDLFLLGVNVDVEARFNAETGLDSSDAFTSVMDALPADDYGAVGYLDMVAVNETMIGVFEATMSEMEGQMGGMESMMGLMQSGMSQSAGRLGIGLTVIDARNLVMDVVAILEGDAMALNPMFVERGPVNPSFAAHIPGEAELVIHDTNLGGQVLAVFEALDQITPMIQTILTAFLESEDATFAAEELLYQMGLYGVDPEEALSFLQGIDLSTIKVGGMIEVGLTHLFAGFTGLNLRDDVLEVLDGDYAMWISVYPLEGDLPVTIDVALAAESTHDDATAYIVTRFNEALDLYNIGHHMEEIGGGQAVALDMPIRALLQAAGAPEDMLNATPELDVMVGANADVVVSGTRPGVVFALSGDSAASLAENPAYEYAAKTLFLPDAITVAFVNVPALMDALPALAPLLGRGELEQTAMVGAVLESATISSTLTDNVGVTRLTLTIPAEPYEVPGLDEIMEESAMEFAPTPPPREMIGSQYDGLLQSVATEGFAQVGNPDAPVTVELYESFSCPHCANFHTEYMDQLVKYAHTGNVTLKSIPMLTGSVPNGDLATAAAYCAGEQGRYWTYHDLLFDWQHQFGSEAFTTTRMEGGAQQLGLDMDMFFDCVQSDRGFTYLTHGMSLASAAGVTGTPTILVNGEQVNPTEMIAIIENALP